jgi:RNA polymerase sigma-70 factor (ECF subfamily)
VSTDWDQLAHARRGDEAAWRDLVERHSPRLLKMALLITGSVAAAQDIAQETFMELHRTRPRHKRGSLKGYLSTIAYHLALKEKRKIASLEPIDEIAPAAGNPSPLEIALAEERERIIFDVIRSLEEGHRDILILRFYGGHSYREIAGISGIPLGTVKSRIFNALKTCRRRLRDKGVLE